MLVKLLCCGSVILGHLSHFREYEGFLITYLYQKILDVITVNDHCKKKIYIYIYFRGSLKTSLHFSVLREMLKMENASSEDQKPPKSDVNGEVI